VTLDAPRTTQPAGRSLVLVAGIPGAGKSTLLRRLPVCPGLAVVDSDTQRDAVARVLPARLPYRRIRPLVHLLHRIAILRAAVAGPAVVVVHLPATGALLRGVIAVLAALTGRTAHLVWLDVAPALALRGQAGRGRVVPSGCFTAHARRAHTTSTALRAGHVPPGYDRVLVLDRTAGPEVLAALVAAPSRDSVDTRPGQ
jgi:hypothetical protein